jgi:hypothetical protein
VEGLVSKTSVLESKALKKGEKKKRRKALKRRTERKQVRRQARTAKPTITTLYHIHQARNYPIEGCWAQSGWDEGGLAIVAIARRQPDGNIVFGNYLVDTYCLGLKNTYCNADVPPGEFRRDYLPKMFRAGPPVDISPALAHEIIYGGIEYAAQFGFHPHADFELSRFVLDPPDVHPRTGAVEFGHNGKPFYVEGPYDNTDAILRQLARTAGEGNFDYLMEIGGPPPDLDDDSD